MSNKQGKPEEIVTKLRQVEVLHSQGTAMTDAGRQIGVSELTFVQVTQASMGASVNVV